MDEAVVADATRRIGDVAIALHVRGHDGDRDIARAIGAEVKRIQEQLHRDSGAGEGCEKCGAPVPVVRIGRPRKQCHSCRPPRYQSLRQSPARASIEA